MGDLGNRESFCPFHTLLIVSERTNDAHLTVHSQLSLCTRIHACKLRAAGRVSEMARGSPEGAHSRPNLAVNPTLVHVSMDSLPTMPSSKAIDYRVRCRSGDLAISQRNRNPCYLITNHGWPPTLASLLTRLSGYHVTRFPLYLPTQHPDVSWSYTKSSLLTLLFRCEQ